MRISVLVFSNDWITIYRIAQNFDVFDAFQLDRQNLTHQIAKNNTEFTAVW